MHFRSFCNLRLHHVLRQFVCRFYSTDAACRISRNESSLISEYMMKHKVFLTEELSTLSKRISSGGNYDIKSTLDRWTKLKALLDLNEKLAAVIELDLESDKLMAELDSGEDPDLRRIVRRETESRHIEFKLLENQMLELILPPDNYRGVSSVHLELIAGAGGLEAALFARDLFNMYQNYAKLRGWSFLTQESSGTEGEGEKNEPIAHVNILIESPQPNEPVYSSLRWEAGVHRVQRIPVTSKLNKIHTSTVAVTVLPAIDEMEVELDPVDLAFEVFRSSGAGGQHVNKTESAVRVRHLPTGTVAACQNGRSQHANREDALKLLKRKLSKELIKTQIEAENSQRKSQMGALDRSDRIRTYNYPQDRVTDHRINRSWTDLELFMRNRDGIDEISSSLDASLKEKFLRTIDKPYFLLNKLCP